MFPGCVKHRQEVNESWHPGEKRVLSDLFKFPTLKVLVLPFTHTHQAFFHINILLDRSGYIKYASKKFKANIFLDIKYENNPMP